MRVMSRTIVFVVVVGTTLSLCAPSLLRAEGLKLNPGLWRMKNTMKMPMLAEPRETVTETCMREEEFTPESLVKDGNGCTLTDLDVSDDTMRWKMNCPGPMGSSIAEGHMTVTDTTAKGAMTNTMNMIGQAMTMHMEWDGKRLGDCP